MKPIGTRLTLVFAGLFLVIATAFGQDGIQSGVDSTSATTANVSLKDVRIDQNLGAQIPVQVPFTDWNGQPVNFSTLLGQHPAILIPIFFTCTGVCTVEMQNLVSAVDRLKDRRLGSDYSVIVLSIKPTETPAMGADKRRQILNSLSAPGADVGWHFLTGSLANIRAVTDAVGFHYTYNPETQFINHPSGIMVLSPNGTVSSYLYGAEYSAETIRKDIDVAAKNQVGAKSQEIFFGCIHIDPLTGKRSLVIQNVLKVLGVVTVLVLLATILTLSGRTSSGRGRSRSESLT